MFDKKKISTFALKLVPYVIAIASAVTAITPNQTDDQLLAAIKQIADVLALNNVGHNASYNDSTGPQCKESD